MYVFEYMRVCVCSPETGEKQHVDMLFSLAKRMKAVVARRHGRKSELGTGRRSDRQIDRPGMAGQGRDQRPTVRERYGTYGSEAALNADNGASSSWNVCDCRFDASRSSVTLVTRTADETARCPAGRLPRSGARQYRPGTHGMIAMDDNRTVDRKGIGAAAVRRHIGCWRRTHRWRGEKEWRGVSLVESWVGWGGGAMACRWSGTARWSEEGDANLTM